MDQIPVFTIGYGSRSFDEFARVLDDQRIEYLIDVRSVPYSRHNLDFTRERLRVLLRHRGIRYVFMGDSLGGRPSDPECYRQGRVDYTVVRDKYFYRDGIGRIRTAWEKGLRVVLMCSEGRPQECHRSKLIGRTLEDEHISVVHLDETGAPKSQEEVIALLEPQTGLFEGQTSSYSSRKQYVPTPMVRETPRYPRVVTIGAHGFDEEGFFAALCQAGVDTFCDIRLRRGMRGSTYAFANSERLQQRLSELGIRYVHRRELAPTQKIRDRQAQADREAGEGKRSRTALAPAFVDAFRSERLAGFDSAGFIRELGQDVRAVALFCVESEPQACHRSLVSERLARDLNLPVEHLCARKRSSSLEPG
jgi:uncharacterized protein (DUF488 family)